MKKTYTTPLTTEQTISQNQIICGSNRIDSNIGIQGGDNSGNPWEAL